MITSASFYGKVSPTLSVADLHRRRLLVPVPKDGLIYAVFDGLACEYVGRTSRPRTLNTRFAWHFRDGPGRDTDFSVFWHENPDVVNAWRVVWAETPAWIPVLRDAFLSDLMPEDYAHGDEIARAFDAPEEWGFAAGIVEAAAVLALQPTLNVRLARTLDTDGERAASLDDFLAKVQRARRRVPREIASGDDHEMTGD